MNLLKKAILRIFNIIEYEWWGNTFIIEINLRKRTYTILKIKDPVISPVVLPKHTIHINNSISLEFNNISKDVGRLLREKKVNFKNAKKRKQIDSVKYILSKNKDCYIIDGWDKRTTKTEVSVPEYIDGIPVRYINPGAFIKSPFKKIVFDDKCSLKGISINAFSQSAIEEIVLPLNTSYIDCEVFSYCENLEKITMSASTKYVGANQFNYIKNAKIKEIVLDYSNGNNSRGWSKNWNNLNIPIKKIGKKSFKDLLKKHNKK